ncbi:MAG: RDD family protein [Gemmatimonadetes bacterium]|jgi:uncharacterized RDD family membrane protein YckC|nr:RDD family protein [Gemmatimonadota bacterium]
MSELHDPFGLVDAPLSARLGAFCVDAALGVAASIPSMASQLLGGLLLILLVTVQTVMLTRSGQTLGKRAVRIRIVRMDTGENGGFVTNVMMRTVLSWILSMIPFYGLVDTIFIFRPDRRCVHDHIAGTRVVDK